MAVSLLCASRHAGKCLLVLIFAILFQRCYLEDLNATESITTNEKRLAGPPLQENAEVLPIEFPPEEVTGALPRESESPEPTTSAPGAQIPLDEEPENVTKNATDLWIVDIDVVSNNLTESVTKNETDFIVIDVDIVTDNITEVVTKNETDLEVVGIDIIPPEEAIDALSREAESSEFTESNPGVQISSDEEPEHVTKNETDLWVVDIDVVPNNITEHATKNATDFIVVDIDIVTDNVTEVATKNETDLEMVGIDIIPPEEAIDALSRESESPESATSAPGVQLSLDEEPEHVTKNATDLWVVDIDVAPNNIAEHATKNATDFRVVEIEAVSNTINANGTKNETDLWVVEIDVVPSNITENVTKNETDFTVADIDVVPVNATERNDIIEPAGVIANIESDSTQGNSTETAKNNDVKVPQTEIAKKKTNIGILALLIALLVVALTIFVIIGCIHWFRKQESLARTAALEKDVVIIAHKKSAWSASGTTPSPSPSPKHSTDTSYSLAGPDGLSPVRVDGQGKLTV